MGLRKGLKQLAATFVTNFPPSSLVLDDTPIEVSLPAHKRSETFPKPS